MDPLNATDSLPFMCRLSLSLACLTSVRSDCFLWRRRCSLAPDAICLLRSVDSSALSYTVRSPPSQSIGIAQNSFSTCTNLKSMLPLFPFVQLKFSVYGHTQTDRQTYTRVLQCSPLVWGSLRLAPMKNPPLVLGLLRLTPII